MKLCWLLIVCMGIIVITRGTIIYTEEKKDNELIAPLVTLPFNKSLNINEITICLKFYIMGSLDNDYVYLFSTTPQTLSLYVNLIDYQGAVYRGTRAFFFIIPPKAIWPLEWFNFCVTFKNDAHHVVANGKIWNSLPISYNDNESNGDFIENIVIGSFHDGRYTFHGRISELNIWNYTMSIEELQNLTTPCNEFQQQPTILNWNTITKNQISFSNIGAAKFVSEDNSMCNLANQAKFKLYVALFDSEGAKHICKIMNAEMYIPKNNDEYKKIMDDSSKGANIKKIQDQCIDNIILPIYQNDEGEFEYHDRKQLPNQLKWMERQPNGGLYQRCVKMNSKLAIYDSFCHSKACPICIWTENTVFVLKGLCPQSMIEYRYVLRAQTFYRGMLVFHGFKGDYFITYNTNLLTWSIVKHLNMHNQSEPINNDNVIGVLTSQYDGNTPVGLQTWKLNDGICKLQHNQLKFTMVRNKHDILCNILFLFLNQT